MSFVRQAIVVGVAAASVLGSAALAAPVPRCLLVINDATGDVTSQYPARAARSDLDIRSVSVATNAAGLRLTMGIARLGAPEVTGTVYETTFSIQGVTYRARAIRDLDSTQFRLSRPALQLADRGTYSTSTPVEGVIDQKASSVSITVPFALIGAPRDGVSLRGISGTSWETLATVGIGTSDETRPGRDFTLHRTACRTP